jgi:hypothetical protein
MREMDGESIIVYDVCPTGEGNPITFASLDDALETIKFEMEESSDTDGWNSWTITIGRMRTSEFEALPEHSGW